MAAPERPVLLRIIRGSPDDAELAALVTALLVLRSRARIADAAAVRPGPGHLAWERRGPQPVPTGWRHEDRRKGPRPWR